MVPLGARPSGRGRDPSRRAVNGFWAAILAAAVIALLNAILPPVVAALRLPLTLVLGFLLVLVLDALMLLAADNADRRRPARRRLLVGAARGARCLRSDARPPGPGRYRRRQRMLVPRRPADRPQDRRRPSRRTRRASSSWRSTASRCPFSAGRCETATRRTWHGGLAEEGTQLTGWETDLSSQTGASQAGILLGSNEDIPAFRWVEKETQHRDDVLGSGRLRRARAPSRDRQGAACSPVARAAATCSPARRTR